MSDEQERDEILQAFQAACPRPTAADITAWVRQHPAFSDDILTHADAALQMAQTEDETAVPSEALVRRIRASTNQILDQVLGSERAKPARSRKGPPSLER